MPNAYTHKLPSILSIAGSDSSAGAGIQADMKTAADFGVYCATAITAITAQNTFGVKSVMPVTPDMISAQIESVYSDLNIRAVKIGLVPTPDAAEAIAKSISHMPDVPVIIDPVMTSTSGKDMSSGSTAGALKSLLFPKATIVTPNIPEILSLLGIEKCTNKQNLMSEFLIRFGSGAVCLKGGHDSGAEAVDRLMIAGSDRIYTFSHPWVDTRNSHGTGCTFSTAIAAALTLGRDLQAAVSIASGYVYMALETSVHYCVGGGTGPLKHNYKYDNI